MSGRCRQHPRAGTKKAKESQSLRGERAGLGTRVVYAFWRPLQRSGSFRARPSDPGAPTRSIMILKLSPPQRAKGNFKNTNRVEKLTKYGFHGPSLDILDCRPKILSKAPAGTRGAGLSGGRGAITSRRRRASRSARPTSTYAAVDGRQRLCAPTSRR